MIKDIIKLVEKRKKGLISLLERDGLNHNTLQQIKGAITESDIFIRILDDHRLDEVGKELTHFKILKSEEEGNKKGFLSKLFEKKGRFWKEDLPEEICQQSS